MILTSFAALALLAAGQAGAPPQIPIQAPYVTTPPEVVEAMLRLAGLNRNDVLYDLGCGDGRIAIAAARRFGAHAVGIDLNPGLLAACRRNATRARVARLVEFRREDLFDTDLSRATVVTMYLLPDVNLALRPKLLRELKPGTRVVSHSFHMGDWKPDKVVQVAGTRIYCWVVPRRG